MRIRVFSVRGVFPDIGRVSSTSRIFQSDRIEIVMGQKKSKPEVEEPTDPNNFRHQLRYSYKTKVLPLEKFLDFEFFYSASLDDAEFEARPSVLLVGGYSVGKTSLIEFLCGQDYPGMRIGPEPTTDSFTVVMYDENSRRMIPGTSLINEATFPYKSLEKFGAPFLAKLHAATSQAPLLKMLTLIDTPGILSGEKQAIGRGYDFEGVMAYLGDKVDVILLLFDPHKLDIPDEVKRVIAALQRNEEKIRIVLNKADSVGPAELNRVRGALMWALGKAMPGRAEVPQVYAGSFWKKPLKQKEYRQLFEEDQKKLLKEMTELTRTTDVRRLNDVAKRARLARVHSYIADTFRLSLPTCGGQKDFKSLATNLETVVYVKVAKKHRLTMGDFPNPDHLRIKLNTAESTQLPRLNPKLLVLVDEFFKDDFTRLYNLLPPDSKTKEASGGVLSSREDVLSMEEEFAFDWKGVKAAAEKSDWRVKFARLTKGKGYLHPANATEFMKDTGLPHTVLNELWRLTDADGDNRLNEEEFYLFCYLIERKKENKSVPMELPPAMRPPSTVTTSVRPTTTVSSSSQEGSVKGQSSGGSGGQQQGSAKGVVGSLRA